MVSLRVRLEFPDNEKFWLFIDLSKIHTIQDVIDYIDNKYSINCHKLWLDDAQLYCRETARILQDRDLIRVSMREPKKRKVDVLANQQNIEPTVEEDVNSSPPSKPKKKKKTKEDKILEFENLPNLMLTECLTEAPVVEKKRKKVKQDAYEPTSEGATVVKQQPVVKQAVKVPSPEMETEPTVHEATPEFDLTNKEPSEEEGAKRKRRRRRRKSHYKNPSEEVDSNLIQPFGSLPDYVPLSPKQRQHFHFEADSGEDAESIVGQANAKTIGFGNLNKPESNGHKTNRANTENPKTKYLNLNTVNPAVYQNPTVASTPQLDALLSLRSAIFSRNSNDNALPVYNNVPPPQALTPSRAVLSSSKVPVSLPAKQKPAKLDPMAFPIIKGLPRINDLIAFKVLELSENYNPEVSDYMQGRITHMSPASEITVELLDPKPKLHSRGKFEIVEQDEEECDGEEPAVEYETTVTYHWSQMIEPRLIFP